MRPAEPQLRQNRVRRLGQVAQREEQLVLRDPQLLLAQKQQARAGLADATAQLALGKPRGLSLTVLHGSFSKLKVDHL